MVRVFWGSVALALSAPSASAAGVAGRAALPLAALIGAHDAALSATDRKTLAALLDARAPAATKGKGKVVVRADRVVCKAGDVDITAHACALTFGTREVELSGRSAHEVFATLVEAGGRSEGAAGTIYEVLTALRCVIDVREIGDRAGGGATCTFAAGD